MTKKIIKSRTELLPFQANCESCGTALRPAQTKRFDWPGTKLHGGNGRCVNCRRKERLVEIEEFLAEPVILPPRELDPEESLALSYVKRYADEMIATMLGLYEPSKGVPLSDIQLMRNGLYVTDGVALLGGDDSVIPHSPHMGIKGRRVA